MAENPNASRLRALYGMENGGDISAWLEALADDVVWHVPGEGGNAGAIQGKEAVGAFFTRVIPDLESFSIEVHDILANDHHAVALVQYDHRRDDRTFSQLGAEVYHFNSAGRISAFWALIDNTSAFDRFFLET